MVEKPELSVGFPPIASHDARILVLGSLPGKESLLHKQYYANTRNGFWHIMGEIAGAYPALPYQERCSKLTHKGIAVWDVLHSAAREGSLDSAIDKKTMQANNIGQLLETCTDIKLVCFNGRPAAELYSRAVLPTLPHALRTIPLKILPSTSPANTMRLETKLVQWKEAFESVNTVMVR